MNRVIALFAASAFAPFPVYASVVIADSTFNPTDWTVVVVGATGGATQGVLQLATGGNPGSYRQISHNLPGPSTIVVSHVFNAVTYDPSTQGAIASIDYSEDRIELSPPFGGAAIGGYFLLQQGGVTWRNNTDLAFSNLSWATLSLTGLIASNFAVVAGATGLPDFSSSGSPITFGVLRSNSNSNASGSYTTTNGLDNWKVTVNQVVPAPPAVWLLGTGCLGLLGWQKRRPASAWRRENLSR